MSGLRPKLHILGLLKRLFPGQRRSDKISLERLFFLLLARGWKSACIKENVEKKNQHVKVQYFLAKLELRLISSIHIYKDNQLPKQISLALNTLPVPD